MCDLGIVHQGKCLARRRYLADIDLHRSWENPGLRADAGDVLEQQPSGATGTASDAVMRLVAGGT
jgi:hypothetical protein